MGPPHFLLGRSLLRKQARPEEFWPGKELFAAEVHPTGYGSEKAAKSRAETTRAAQWRGNSQLIAAGMGHASCLVGVRPAHWCSMTVIDVIETDSIIWRKLEWLGRLSF
jgi:hypothetical protein